MISEAYIDSIQILPDTGDHGLSSIGGLGSPSPRRDTISRPRAHGDIDFTRYYEGRVISLSGYTFGPTMEEANTKFDLLKAELLLGTDHLFRFRRIGMAEDEQLVVRAASAIDTELSGASMLIRWGVDLLAPDPRIYSASEKSGDYDPVAAGSGTGVVFPLVFPLVFAGVATTHLTVENSGNFSTPPIFTVSGPVTNPIIDNDTTGESIQTSGLTLAAGETIVIDVGRRVLEVAGVARMDYLDAGNTEWFELSPGSNDLRLRGGSMVLGQTSLAVTFHDARI